MRNKPGRQTKEVEIATQVVELALDRVSPVDGLPISLILPRGISKSKQEIIATGLKQFEGSALDHIILISEAPGDKKANNIQLLNHGSIDTLVGKIEVDTNLAEALIQIMPSIEINAAKAEFVAEFSQLFPFLKRVCPFTKVIPILLPPNDIKAARDLANILASMLQEKKAALVALSNLEDLTLTAIEFCDIDILLQSIPLIKDHTEANQTISHASVVAAVQFAQNLNSNTTTVLKSALDQGVNVNQKTHQASVMLYKYTPPVLVEAQQDTLIQLAKDAITSYIIKRETPLYKTDDPAFLRKSGVFVTIRQKGALRGCIGRLQPDMPLYRVVQEIAVAAATSDPRFPPIQKEEIQGLEFKIAVLSPLQRITTDEVQVGKHGLLIAHQGHRGVLLPDVPVSRGWDRETFLANLCLKAGLPPRTWRENPTLYAFTTVEFGDG